MKLLVDMNLSPRWVEFLQAHGIEAVHWSTVGAFDVPDQVIMGYAKAHGYVVLTHDLDFGAILAATGGDGPSVVQLRASTINPETIGLRVIQALERSAVDLAAGALVTIDADRARLRLLPLRP